MSLTEVKGRQPVGSPVLAAGAGVLVMPVVAVTVFFGSGAADPPTTSCGGTPLTGWTSVYRHDFTDLQDVSAWQSEAADNARLRPDDVENKPLQHPTLSRNVSVEPDPEAEDGAAMAVWTRPGSYPLPGGGADGWTNARMGINGHDQAPPVRVRTRLRMTPSVGTKSAVMWWPSGGGWPWEVDFAETFGGDTLTDQWGGRQRVDQRWHADLDGDGEALEQMKREYHLDATRFHVYDLIVLPDRMSVEIDGTEVLATTDRRFIPTGPGFFSIGKALTGRRDLPGRTPDAVVVDWLEIHRPALPTDPSAPPSAPGVPSGSSPAGDAGGAGPGLATAARLAGNGPAGQPGAAAAGGNPAAGGLPDSIGVYRDEQIINAGHILVAGRQLGVDLHGQTIAIMTAIGESMLINVDHGDTAGPDSRGLFQQRDNGAWGSYADRMNPHTAASNFYRALLQVPGWQTLAPTAAAHAVQRNADSGYYSRFWPDAVQIVSVLAGDPDLASKLPATGDTTGCVPGGPITGPGGTFPPEDCTIRPDPTTGRGCLTPRTLNVASQLQAQGWSISCWDAHAWNPDSDHPDGRGCDVFPGRAGTFPAADEKARGDALAATLQASAPHTGISYLIWYGRIWSVARDDEGWRPYTGGGIYDPTSPTGGHYDHIHLSMY